MSQYAMPPVLPTVVEEALKAHNVDLDSAAGRLTVNVANTVAVETMKRARKDMKVVSVVYRKDGSCFVQLNCPKHVAEWLCD